MKKGYAVFFNGNLHRGFRTKREARMYADDMQRLLPNVVVTTNFDNKK